MRKKGKIWGDKYQSLIVSSYQGGMFISEIMSLPEIAELSPSEYTIRNILKANNVKANWKKKKRRPEFWSDRTVDLIIDLRNEGKSIRAILDIANKSLGGGKTSKSTIVRVLESNADRVSFKPTRKRDIWKPRIANKIVEMYESGMLINDIRCSELLREFKPSGYVIRDILKKHGVKLTWKKGELRRWPEELQRKVVDFYRSGMKFSDLQSHPELKPYSPTNYAIRKILKKYGVKTKGETRYKQPISEERFRAYRKGRLSLREESIIHKHLAVNQGGRERMIKRMRLDLADSIPAEGRRSETVKALQQNARRWAEFFSWGVQNLSDEKLKKEIIKLGMEFGTTLKSLKSALRQGDTSKKRQAWNRVAGCSVRMSELFFEVLKKPAGSFEIQAIC